MASKSEYLAKNSSSDNLLLSILTTVGAGLLLALRALLAEI